MPKKNQEKRDMKHPLSNPEYGVHHKESAEKGYVHYGKRKCLHARPDGLSGFPEPHYGYGLPPYQPISKKPYQEHNECAVRCSDEYFPHDSHPCNKRCTK